MKRGLVRAARARASGKSFSAKVVFTPRTSAALALFAMPSAVKKKQHLRLV